MTITRIVFILTAVLAALAIDQQCTPSTACPGSSYCDTNQAYCICNPGFIGNCNTQASQISNTLSSCNISANQQLLFSINPQKLNSFIEYTLQICTNVSSLSISIMLWSQNGYITNYTQTNGLTSPTSFTVTSSQCLDLLTPFIKSSQQPNGQNSLIIMGINDTSSINATLTIGVSQHVVQGFVIEYYLIIGISIFIVILIVLTIVYVVCKRRKRRNLSAQNNNEKKQSQYNDIQFFKDYMPLIKAMQLANQTSVCAICFQQIEPAEVIRRTPCNHIYHSNCIDSWCLKTLNCPVCRENLSLQAFTEKSLRRNTQISQRMSNNIYEDKWEQEDIEHFEISIGNKDPIRQSML